MININITLVHSISTGQVDDRLEKCIIYYRPNNLVDKQE